MSMEQSIVSFKKGRQSRTIDDGTTPSSCRTMYCSSNRKDAEPRLGGAMMHLIEGGGKRLRAVLPSLVGEAVGNHHSGHHDLGAAIEIIHNFTLVHDDIMDNDPIRRGRPAAYCL